MEFAELKKKVRDEMQINEPDFIKDADDVLNIGYLDVNPTQKVIFSISTFKGKRYFDIRHWVQAETGSWMPTKKGIHLAFERFEEFASALQTFSRLMALD